MYALIREVAPSVSLDVTLGIFSTQEKAEEVRKSYLSRLQSGQRQDPWLDYKRDPLSEENLIIVKLRNTRSFRTGEKIFVVSAYAEGFGQIMNDIRCIVGSKEEAEIECNRIRMTEDYTCGELVQEAVIDEELSDSYATQPYYLQNPHYYSNDQDSSE